MSAQTPKFQQDLTENTSLISDQHRGHELDGLPVGTDTRTSDHDEALGLERDELEITEVEQTTNRILDDQALQNSGIFNT